MKAILEINGFQKIIDVDEPRVIIQVHYMSPLNCHPILDNLKRESEFYKLTFRLEKQLGQFLLYKPT